MGFAVCTINFNLAMGSGTREGRKDCNRSFAIPWPFSMEGGKMGKILTVEEMAARVSDADDLATKSRVKVNVLTELFGHLSHEDNGFELEDSVAWAMGMKEICADMHKDLEEVSDRLSWVKDCLEFYNIDMEKVKKKNKYRKSIGIDEPLEITEV